MKLSTSFNLSYIRPELLLLLIFLAPLPSLFNFSSLSRLINIPLLYTVFAGFRELVIISLGLNTFFVVYSYVKRKFSALKLIYLLFPVLGLFSISYHFFAGEISTQLLIIGLRFLVLTTLPLTIYLSPPRIDPKHKTILLRICFFYFIISIICFVIGFQGYPPYYGTTFLGPRFGFVYENPITAARSFAGFSIFLYFMILESRSQQLKILYLVFIALYLFLCLFTGGRTGLLLVFLSFASRRRTLQRTMHMLQIPQ